MPRTLYLVGWEVWDEILPTGWQIVELETCFCYHDRDYKTLKLRSW